MNAAMEEYEDRALLDALPPRRHILALGPSTERLKTRYLERNGDARWTTVDWAEASARRLRERGAAFDLILLGDARRGLCDLPTLLLDLHAVCTEDAEVIVCVRNGGSAAEIEAQLYGERGCCGDLSPRSAFKVLLDGGWLPAATGGYNIRHPNARYLGSLVDAAAFLGISKTAVERNLCAYELVLKCRRDRAPRDGSDRIDVTVVVHVVNETQAMLNAARSPGLQEIGANLIFDRDSESAAAAVASARTSSESPWFLVCEDDVYFPRGFGHRLAQAVAHRAPSDEPQLVGFAGVGIDSDGAAAPAGLMIDRFKLFDFPATRRAVAMEDCAVLLHRELALPLDPELGWDLWATDVCLRSTGNTSRAEIVRVPLFHNAQDDPSITERLLMSAMELTEKYSNIPTILTKDWSISRSGGIERSGFF
jgi:hypothetical protein